ncbi:MAG: M1 family metallopeptidase [Gemmatimonadetes bacterium]|jgi:alanyl aminopeptidase|nr:M1 family metallopeptidase [Gemmatimonadota bacterium]
MLLALLTLAQVSAQDSDYRLPKGITPSSQVIALALDPSQDGYTGVTTLLLTIDHAVEQIGIYQVDLQMVSIKLKGQGLERELAATVGEWEMSWLGDGELIPAGEYELTIEFRGKFSTDSLGMHRVAFEDNSYIFTQMEAMRARTAFPVFDEPSFKIPYQVTISAPASHAVVSNTPVASREVDDGWQTVAFMQTPPMSSYLLAWAVGPLDSTPLEGLSVPGHVYTPRGHAHELGFVLRETPKIISALEQYFGTAYPYRKLDFVAVPEFAFGAMENAGLVAYRTDLLLIGDQASGRKAENVLNTIAHEVAHMWYGDLVTMAWWDDLWLNEAFATWMARSILEGLYPEYESVLKLPQAGAFPRDQLTSAKPIRRTLRNEAEIIDGLGLKYTKGSAVLRMLEHYVGADVWQQAIRVYVDRFAWKNATEQDLWDVVSETAGIDVGRIAGDYLNQPGFATVQIGKDGTISQHRYLTLGREAADLLWHIPLNVKYKEGDQIHEITYLLDGEIGKIDLPEHVSWVLPDAGANGYYRWQIDPRHFQGLIHDMDELSDREKIGLLGNTEALLNAGELSLADFLAVVNRLLADPHPLVFLPALERVKAIGDDFVGVNNREPFARFIDHALSERFTTVGIDRKPNDSEALIQMRPRLVRVLGEFGSDPRVSAAAAEIADRYLEAPESVDADLAREALRTTALGDDGRRYAQYKQVYLSSSSADQKTNILTSMYFDDPDIVRQHLDFSISADVPAGDAATGLFRFNYVLHDHAILYDWLASNEEAFLKKIPEVYHGILPRIIGASVCSDSNLELLRTFFADRGELYQASLAKTVEGAQLCMERRARHDTALIEFLAQYQ